MSSSMNCCICSQIAGQKGNDLLSKHLDSQDAYLRRIPLETPHFALIPSIGPIVRGHVLICPKRHCRSIAALTSELHPEYQAFKRKVTDTLKAAFGRPIHCFEHGAASRSARLICTVEHAHLHLVPAPAKISQIVLETLPWSRLTPGMSLASVALEGEYLTYESPSGENFVAQQEEPFESQLMRKIFASALNRANSWNWREDPRAADVEATLGALTKALADASSP